MNSEEKIRVCIVENDFIISEMLSAILKKIGHTVAGIAVNETEGITMLKIQKPDIALLDIGLNKEHGGVEIARYIRSNMDMPFIYITGNSDKATLARARDTNPDAYLLKPFREEDISTSIEIALHNFRQRQQQYTSDRAIFIKYNGEHHKLNADDILYIESRHVYVSIVTTEKEMLVRTSLGEFYESIGQKHFVKTHRSFIVNTRHIQRFDSNFVYIDKYKIPVSKTYLQSLEEVLNR